MRKRKRKLNFNPRSPCGERLCDFVPQSHKSNISIHALRVESDQGRFFVMEQGCISIHALRVESDRGSKTNCPYCGISIHALRVESDYDISIVIILRLISIHALRVESDLAVLRTCERLPDFNPRSPCGERPRLSIFVYKNKLDFNPRSPCGERHLINDLETSVYSISIHALRVESDW